jgi:non-ribosomal peptide synthetase component E (peptide arylation enzyme)
MTAVANAIGVRQPLAGVVYPAQDDLRRYVEAGLFGRETLPEAFAESFHRNAKHTAVCGPEGTLTYGKLDQLTDRAGAALLRLGLKPLDRVMFQLGNSTEFLIAFIGCLKAGLIPVCTLAAHRENEIGYLARHAQARGHIVQGDEKFDLVGFASELKARIPSMHVVLSTRGAARHGVPRLEDLMQNEDPAQAPRRLQDVPRDPFQAAVFQLSGGTTGVPKLIPRFHNEYAYNMRAVARYMDYRRDDVMYMPLPMVHNANMACAWGPILLVGAAFAVTPQVTPEATIQMLRECRPTWLAAGVKQALIRLKAAIDASGMTLERVRGVWTINAAKYTRDALGVPGCHIFGMAEGLIMFTRESDPPEAREQTVGKPVCELDQVRLLGLSSEEDVAPGQVGELAIKGPYTIHGYYDAPERNQQAFTRDGFYRSGDLMSARVIGGATYYVFEGRLKDVIDRGGEKVNCEEVELALADHEAVAEAGVVGMPDPGLGERVCAFVTLRPGFSPGEVGVAQFAQHLEALGFAKYKWPERVEIMDSLPATNVGKPDKAELRRIAQGFSKESRP